MPKLPRVSANELVRALRRAGFEDYAQKGSHLHLRRSLDNRQVTVPMHGGNLPVGLIHDVVKQAGLSVDEFIALLK
ncbi:MAG: type II toxin-antitoxin system HicA family toxin [Armatimonadota bacterium]